MLAGELALRQGNGTKLTGGCSALRMATNRVQCWALESRRFACKSRPYCPPNPVELLYLSLQLVPACYRRFELRVAQPRAQLHVEAHKDTSRYRLDRRKTGREAATSFDSAVADFESAAELAAAMRRWGAEDLLVHLSVDQRSITVRRASDTDDDAVNVQRAEVMSLELDYHPEYCSYSGAHPCPACM